LLDLGKWAGEEYRVAGDPVEIDSETERLPKDTLH